MSNDKAWDEFMRKSWQARVQRQLEIWNSPALASQRKRIQDEWNARPWHEKARIKTKAWITNARIRLGEIIAGREFE